LTLRPSQLGFSHYGEPKNFGIVSGGLNEQFARFRREVESLISASGPLRLGPAYGPGRRPGVMSWLAARHSGSRLLRANGGSNATAG
jgi:hypothetical protein